MVGGDGSDVAVRRRIVLLGASNLTRSLSIAVETAWNLWGRPLELLIATGHGRSFGMPSTVLGRRLPGIVECGLWQALAEHREIPTNALITDIGNDLLYGAQVSQITDWIATCLERLRQARADVVITALPLDTAIRLPKAWLAVFQRLLFPSSRITPDEVLMRAADLNERLAQIATERQIPLIHPSPSWYGIDPIHIRRRHWSSAWHTALGVLHDHPEASLKARGSLRRAIYLHHLAPQQRWLFGHQQCRQQPSGKLDDGTTIALY